jgi:hypothetical protein
VPTYLQEPLIFKAGKQFLSFLSRSALELSWLRALVPTLTALRVLFPGRHKGGHHRAHELGHEGYKEMGKKGGASTAEQSGQEAAQGDIEAEIERIKKLPEAEKKKLDERARNGEVVVPGGTGGKSLEAQLHLAEGKSDFGI